MNHPHEVEKKELAIPKRNKLSQNQGVLYRLIAKKVEDGEPIYFEEAKKMYLENACRNMILGVPHYYSYYHHKNEKDEWCGGNVPLTEYEIAQRSLQWLTQNIGILVIKGYLKIIPQIQL